MKFTTTRISLALALICCASSVHAQEADVTGGSLTIAIAPQLATVLQAQGVSASSSSLLSGSKVPFLAIGGGVFDLASGCGSFATAGGFYVVSSTTRLKVVDLMFETVGPYPVVTGSIFVNGHFAGNTVIFDITTPNPLHAPFAPGSVIIPGIQANLSPAFGSLLGSTFNIIIPPSIPAGILSVNTELITLNVQ